MLNSRKSLDIILSEIEEQVKKDLDYDEKRNKIGELHQSVPEPLKRRLTKILPPEIFAGDEAFEEDKTKMKVVEPDLEAEIRNQLPRLNEILDEQDISANVDGALNLMQQAYKEIELTIDDQEGQRERLRQAKKVNWIADYVRKLRRHRVQWDSKIYRDNPQNWQKKSMIENVETMIDLSAKEFSDWVNSLASEEKKTITPELIKQLFTIETEGSAPRGLHVEPVDLNILPPVVVKKFDQHPFSKLDLEFKMNKLRQSDKIANAKLERGHAFGRSLPNELKQKRREGMLKDIKPVFPEDLQTKEALFKGIEHLQVTRSIFEFIGQSKRFRVPDYLRKNSLFNRTHNVTPDDP